MMELQGPEAKVNTIIKRQQIRFLLLNYLHSRPQLKGFTTKQNKKLSEIDFQYFAEEN